METSRDIIICELGLWDPAQSDRAVEYINNTS